MQLKDLILVFMRGADSKIKTSSRTNQEALMNLEEKYVELKNEFDSLKATVLSLESQLTIFQAPPIPSEDTSEIVSFLEAEGYTNQ